MKKLDPQTEKALLKLIAQREKIEDQIDQLLSPPKQAGKARKVAKKAPKKRARDGPVNNRLAIVVGHTQVAPGANGVAPVSAAEYPWNKDLAAMIAAAGSTSGVAVKVVFRDSGGISGAYDAVGQWHARAAIELHFNAANGSARGTETLHGTAAASQAWAQAVQAAQVALYGRTGNHNRGLRRCPPHPRGGASVNALPAIPTCLIEPFFGDNPADAALGQTKKQGLANALVGAFKSHFSIP